MALNTYSSSTLLQKMGATFQASATQVLNLAVGTVITAIFEAVRDVAMWLQSLVFQLLQATRLSTSSGTYVDSFVGDFGMTRLAAFYASGAAAFSRTNTANQAVIPAATANGTAPSGQTIWSGGSQIQTSDGTQTFTVIPDATQAAYNAGLNAYVIPSGTTSITATVQANNTGTGGNVAAGTITVISQPIQFVTSVTNASAFTNGANAETDAALQARFALYVASLPRSTAAAVQAAVEAIQTGATAYVVENKTYAGAAQVNYFYAVVDDGSGNPPSSFITAASNAADAYRPIGSTFGIYSPVIETAAIAMTLTTGAGYVHSTVTAQVQSALQAYINALPLGTTLYRTRLEQVAYDTSPGVVDVSGTTINGGSSDLVVTPVQVVKAGTITVS